MKKTIINIILILTLGVCSSFESVWAQEHILITGVVKDAIGKMPLAEVNVSIPGYPDIKPVKSAEDGSFEIEVIKDVPKLRFTFPGYKKREISIDFKKSMEVFLFSTADRSLEDDVSMYKRSVEQEKLNIASSVLYNEKIDGNLTSFEQSIQGKIPGMQIITRSGLPGEGAMILSRGINSLNLINQPLIVIDDMVVYNPGVISPVIDGYYGNPLINLQPEDIESITFLKGAEASLFGSLGGNDVILIYTKEASQSNTEINFTATGGVSNLSKKIPMLGNNGFVDLATTIAKSKYSDVEVMELFPYLKDDNSMREYQSYNNNTDWQDEVFSQAIDQNYQLSLKGGDAIAKYYISLGYRNQEAILDNTTLQKYNSRVNADVKITKDLTVKASVGFGNRELKMANLGTSFATSPIYSALAKSPTLYPISKNYEGEELGKWDPVREYGVTNPVALLAEQNVYSKNFNIFSKLSAGWDITSKLKLNGTVGMNFMQDRQNSFIPGKSYLITSPMRDGEAENSVGHMVGKSNNIFTDIGVSYTSPVGDNNMFYGMAGFRTLSNSFEYDFGTGINTQTDDFTGLGNTQKPSRLISGMLGDWNWMSGYMQLNYDISGKYLFNVNASVDASSLYGANVNKFSVFPSVSAAWNISNENFMVHSRWIKQLKIRAEAGMTGNGNVPSKAARFYYMTKVYRNLAGIVRKNIPNEDLKCENIFKYGVGLDLVTRRERLSISFDLYNNIIKDMVITAPVSPILGFDDQVLNSGEMSNKGFDIGVRLRLIDNPVRWSVYANVGTYTSQIESLGKFNRLITDIPGGGELITQKGEAPYMFYGYKTDDVFISGVQAEAAGLVDQNGNSFSAGDMKFVDRDGNKVIDKNDKFIIGNPNPDWVGGFGTSIAYKNIQLDADFTYSYGNDVFNYQRMQLESMSSMNNQTLAALKRWRYDGQPGVELPKAVYGDPMGNARFSDRWIEDGSYIRLKKLMISYRLPEVKFLQNSSVFIAGYNLMTWTNYLGFDPEFHTGNDVVNLGIDYGRIPIPKTVMIGVKIGL